VRDRGAVAAGTLPVGSRRTAPFRVPRATAEHLTYRRAAAGPAAPGPDTIVRRDDHLTHE
jgi:hypothetical protein